MFDNFGSRSGQFTNLTVVNPGSQDYSNYGSFSLSGNDLDWTPVPEPSAPLALALLLSASCLVRRRKALSA